MRATGWMLPLLALLLTGCATAPSDPAPAVICPALISYPADIQARAADELDQLQPASPVRQMMNDYGDLRARIRACQHRNH